MMLANDLKTYYDEVRRYLDCPKDEQDRLLLSIIACVAVVVVALSTLTIYTTTRQSNVHITEENYTFVDDNKVDDNKNVLDVENAVSYVESLK